MKKLKPIIKRIRPDCCNAPDSHPYVTVLKDGVRFCLVHGFFKVNEHEDNLETQGGS